MTVQNTYLGPFTSPIILELANDHPDSKLSKSKVVMLSKGDFAKRLDRVITMSFKISCSYFRRDKPSNIFIRKV